MNLLYFYSNLVEYLHVYVQYAIIDTYTRQYNEIHILATFNISAMYINVNMKKIQGSIFS